jgi:NAD(P)-dependent dehydrogenase (short-subunit alcohol dehydrogenase family)
MASLSQLTPVKTVQLEGKLTAITGADRGISLGIADCCLSNGAQAIYCIDIGEIADELGALSKNFLTNVCPAS